MILKAGEHLLIVGRTGTGKSVACYKYVIDYVNTYPDHGLLIVNHKNDKDWNDLIPPIKRGKVPKYKVGKKINWAVLPYQTSDLDAYLWDIYEAGKPCLIVFDEGQAIPQRMESSKAIWTQGRSLKMSIITNTQRPAQISLFAITQASYIRVFNIIGKDDLKTLDGYMDAPIEKYISPSTVKRGEEIAGKKLEPFHSVLYTVKTGDIVILPPEKMVKHPPIVEKKKPLPYIKIGVGLSILTLLKGLL